MGVVCGVGWASAGPPFVLQPRHVLARDRIRSHVLAHRQLARVRVATPRTRTSPRDRGPMLCVFSAASRLGDVSGSLGIASPKCASRDPDGRCNGTCSSRSRSDSSRACGLGVSTKERSSSTVRPQTGQRVSAGRAQKSGRRLEQKGASRTADLGWQHYLVTSGAVRSTGLPEVPKVCPVQPVDACHRAQGFRRGVALRPQKCVQAKCEPHGTRRQVQSGAHHLDANAGQLHRGIGGTSGPDHCVSACRAAMRSAMRKGECAPCVT